MTRWIAADDPAWEDLFTRHEESGFLFRAQQHRGGDREDQALTQFLCGEPVDIDWRVARTREQVTGGRSMTRVLVVVEPQTSFMRLELRVCAALAEAGEEIKVLTLPAGSGRVGVPEQDFWLVDDREVWRLHHHRNFRPRGAELIDDPAEVADHRRARDVAVRTSTPLTQYLLARPEIAELRRT